jgi:hypothetical protein
LILIHTQLPPIPPSTPYALPNLRQEVEDHNEDGQIIPRSFGLDSYADEIYERQLRDPRIRDQKLFLDDYCLERIHKYGFEIFLHTKFLLHISTGGEMKVELRLSFLMFVSNEKVKS